MMVPHCLRCPARCPEQQTQRFKTTAVFLCSIFTESFNTAKMQGPLLPANKTCKISSDKDRQITKSSNAKKITYSKHEIEQKRLEAQRRRLAKRQATSSQTQLRHGKIS